MLWIAFIQFSSHTFHVSSVKFINSISFTFLIQLKFEFYAWIKFIERNGIQLAAITKSFGCQSANKQTRPEHFQLNLNEIEKPIYRMNIISSLLWSNCVVNGQLFILIRFFVVSVIFKVTNNIISMPKIVMRYGSIHFAFFFSFTLNFATQYKWLLLWDWIIFVVVVSPVVSNRPVIIKK